MRRFFKRGGRRGSVLLLSLFFMFTLFLMAVAFFKLLPTELQTAARANKITRAHYAADAGLREAVAFLKTQPKFVSEADLDNLFNNANGVHTNNYVVIGDDTWSYTADITGNGPGNANASAGVYDVVAVAFYRGQPYRRLQATVRNESFAKYAMFIDNWPDTLTYTMGDAGIQGPFHTNGWFRLKTPSSTYLDEDVNLPQFTPFVSGPLARMTYAQRMDQSLNELGVDGDGVEYRGGNVNGTDPGRVPFNSTTNEAIDDRYNRMIEGGRERIAQVANIALPEQLDSLRQDAWDDATQNQSILDGPTLAALNDGPNVNTTAGANGQGGDVLGGVFIKGQARSTQMLITSDNNQQIRVRSPDIDAGQTTLWRVRIDPPPYDTQEIQCVPDGGTQTVPNIVQVPCVQNQPYDCNCRWEEVIGDNGLGVDVWVCDTCYQQVNSTCPEQQGTIQVPTCTNQSVTVTINPPPYWVNNINPNDYTIGTDNVIDLQSYNNNLPDFYNYNSVVEVTEASGYQIPYIDTQTGQPSIVDGVPLTGTNDPRRNVPENQTVFISNDMDAHSRNPLDTNGQPLGRRYTVLNGSTNGIVFGDSHIDGLSGINKGSRYVRNGVDDYHGRVIAANISSNARVTINNDLLQFYNGSDPALDGPGSSLRPGNPSPTDQHILGIIARDVVVDHTQGSSSWWNGSNDARTLDVYGVVLAGRQHSNGSTSGAFSLHSSDRQSNDGMGQMRLFGGVIQAHAGQFQGGYSNGSGPYATGMALNLNYDEIAAQNLENFPTTQTFQVLRYVQNPVGE